MTRKTKDGTEYITGTQLKFRAYGGYPAFMQEVDGYNLYLKNQGLCEVWEGSSWSGFSIREEKSELIPMQYSGVKDKNGKEIYEGDILLHPTFGNCLVIFKYGSFGINVTSTGDRWTDGFKSFSTVTANYDLCEVVGNIFQNPELDY